MNIESSALRNAADENTGRGRWQAGAERYKDKMMSELKTIVGDAERLLKLAAETSSDGFATAREKLDRQMGWTRDKLGDAGKAVKQNARRSTAAARWYVKDNPFRAVGIAAVAGLVIGLVVVTYLNNRKQ